MVARDFRPRSRFHGPKSWSSSLIWGSDPDSGTRCSNQLHREISISSRGLSGCSAWMLVLAITGSWKATIDQRPSDARTHRRPKFAAVLNMRDPVAPNVDIRPTHHRRQAVLVACARRQRRPLGLDLPQIHNRSCAVSIDRYGPLSMLTALSGGPSGRMWLRLGRKDVAVPSPP